ncbi:hypothetical protein [Pseudorhodoferax sp. Leaf267]|uniref:hypothetical protein n=1 Tax=Pseudorhodoferax sp. Leaf267 TaxID=1736316 RepID=UPI0006F376E8|nr:hypothetical protein [Pseudorhodoferax sp. Leaf267]KQP17657.1 hypothetical protein ASF43_07140 [Pseudorhodoferax sp. Leaf267]
MTTKPHAGATDTQTPPTGAPQHKDNALESLGKAITDAVWESSGEADKSHKGAERRAAAERVQDDETPPER